jgi:hypothetical protein
MVHLSRVIFSLLGLIISLNAASFTIDVDIDAALKKQLTQSKPEGQAISVVGSTCDPQLINCKRTKASLVVPYPMYDLEYDFWLKLFKQNEYLFNQWFSTNPQGVAFISVQFIQKDGTWVNLGCDQKTFSKDEVIHMILTPKSCTFN